MTDVSLKAFRFALPTKVEIDGKSNEQVKANTEFPQEFFGLPPMEQVSVINALLRASVSHVESMESASVEHQGQHDWSPLHIGISVVLKKVPRLEIDAEFNFPEGWKDIPHIVRKKALKSFAYLMQSAGVSIVEREEKYGAENA